MFQPTKTTNKEKMMYLSILLYLVVFPVVIYHVAGFEKTLVAFAIAFAVVLLVGSFLAFAASMVIDAFYAKNNTTKKGNTMKTTTKALFIFSLLALAYFAYFGMAAINSAVNPTLVAVLVPFLAVLAYLFVPETDGMEVEQAL